MFKVITHIEKKGGCGYWMRIGSGFPNKDDSINVYLDAMPKSLEFQLRELDAEDLAKRERFQARGTGPQPTATSNPLPF
jgi:hypothetical protein